MRPMMNELMTSASLTVRVYFTMRRERGFGRIKSLGVAKAMAKNWIAWFRLSRAISKYRT